MTEEANKKSSNEIDKENQNLNHQEDIRNNISNILRENLELNRLNVDEQKEELNIAKELGLITSLQSSEILKANKDIAKVTSKLAANEDDIQNHRRSSTDITKDILKNEDAINRAKSEELQLQLQLTNAKEADKGYYEELINTLQEQMRLADINKDSLNSELSIRKKIENATGLTGKSLAVINKLTGNQIGDLGEIKQNTLDELASLQKKDQLLGGFWGKMQGFGIQVKHIGKSIMKNMNDPLVILQSLMDFSNQTRDLQRGLGISGKEAYKFRNELSMAAATSGDLLATSAGLLEANQKLNQVRGTGVMFTEKQLLDTNRLLKAEVMTAEAAGELSRLANVTGQGIREAYLNQIDGVLAAEQESGVRLDIKSTLEATNKVSGQVRAQLGANPKALGEAVAQAKALGMELSDVAAAGKSILNFESSIEAELTAELLTGKQLNLEKARLAALTGDYKTLTEEINKNVGDFGDFTSMNVLQQDALAASLGMSTDALSDQLLKKADLNALASEARAEGKEDVAAQLEALSASDKMNASVEKLKGLFGDIMGIMAPILDGFASLVGWISESTVAASILVGVIGALAVKSLVSAVTTLWQSFMSIGPWGIAGAIAGTAVLMGSYSKAKSQKLAEGGVVKPSPGGTLATIGEAGEAEAVVPLSKAAEMGFGASFITPKINTNESSGINKDDLITALRTVEKEKPKQPVIIREKDSNYSDASPSNTQGNNYSIKYETSFS